MSICLQDIQKLLNYFSKNTYKAKECDPASDEAMRKCIELMQADYSYFLLSNSCGELSAHYPSQLIIPEYELHTSGGFTSGVRSNGTIYESLGDVHKLRDLISRARFARCRARFPLPVILYKGKYVCRSATLSGGPEIYGRSGLDYFFCNSENAPDLDSVISSVEGQLPSQSEWHLFNRVRSQDIKLLKTLNVSTIIDFMVEKKKVKFGMNITSSEKVDKEKRYADFSILSLPYPGCEFFREYRDNDYSAEGLVFDWSQTHVDACVRLPDEPLITQMRIDWNKYKVWDLVKITQNYMKLLLKYLQESNAGILIHCISGWDRTPLFVSMLRLSLWADGLVHQSLDAHQILYLTIAYDWMLFGHHLADRLGKGEEIFFFCFYMLKYLADEEFSVQPLSNPARSAKSATKLAASGNGVSVLRTDSDSQLDYMWLENESRGSSISLNSSCSSLSSKSQDAPSVFFHNHGEEFLNGCERRTSPVSMPASSNKFRQRQESSSSMSVGSWQIISGTGSLRGSDSNDSTTLMQNSGGPPSQDSSCTLTEDDLLRPFEHSRKEKLQLVRTAFYNCYCSTIGFKFKSGPDSSLGSFFGNFAEKVGFSQRA